jgi:hypothetical protein
MEQHVYHGNINPDGLADFLVNSFNNYMGRYAAQKIGQGDHILVQIGRMRYYGMSRGAIGVSISRTNDGIIVSAGQSNYLSDAALVGNLMGAIFWPPMLLFPLARGIRNYGFYQDVWNAIDTYCTQAGATPGDVSTMHGVYCQNCGALNDEGVETCHMCSAPIATAVQRDQAPQYQSPAPQGTVTCSNCGQTVAATKFCGNCGAHLT